MLLKLGWVRRVWRALTWYWVLFFLLQWVFALIPPLTEIIKGYKTPWSSWEDDVQRWLLLKNMGNSWIYQFISLFAAAFQHRVFVSQTDAVLQAAANEKLAGGSATSPTAASAAANAAASESATGAGSGGAEELPPGAVYASPFANALAELEREQRLAEAATAQAQAQAQAQAAAAAAAAAAAQAADNKDGSSNEADKKEDNNASTTTGTIALLASAAASSAAAEQQQKASHREQRLRGLAALFKDREMMFIMKVQSLKTYLMGVLIFVFFVGAYEAAVAMNIFSGSYLMLALYLCNRCVRVLACGGGEGETCDSM
jgi:hypothetical protein